MAAFRDRKPYARPTGRSNRADGEWLHDRAPSVPGTTPTAPAPRKQQPPTAPSNSNNSAIQVSNLHYEVTVKDLQSIFGKIGTLVREPRIRYDRSGRSSGIAIVWFEKPEEAAEAIRQFNGLLCKNQPMTIGYDSGPPTRPSGARRVVSAPSLLNRIQKPPLLERLAASKNIATPQPSTQNGPGPIRSRPRPRGGAPQPRAPKKPMTAEDLDKELDTFMGGDGSNGAPATPAPKATAGGPDIEMSS